MNKNLSKRQRISALFEALESRRLFSGYAITDLGTLGGSTSQAFGINSAGDVVGQSMTSSGETHAFLFTGGVMTDLGTLGGTESHAYGINDLGQIVGDSTDANGNDHAFLYHNSTMTDLGTLGGNTSVARAINLAGTIAGYSTTAGGDTHAFSFPIAGTMTDIGTLGGTSSYGYGINSSGEIVGYSLPATGEEHAFLYSNGTMTNLGTLGGTQSFAYAGINDSSVVAGDSSTAKAGHPFNAFLYNGSISNIGTLGGSDIFVRSINNAGQVVGDSLTASGGNYDAFVYSNGTFTDLNSAATVGWTLDDGEAINTNGQIVGSGTNAGSEHAFLLTPSTDSTGVLTPTITKSSLPSAVVIGAKLKGKVTISVTNSSGSAVKGNALIALYASTDSGDTTVTSFTKKVNLKPGKSKSFTLSVKSLPAAFTRGIYNFRVQVTDPSGNIANSSTGPSITTADPFVALAQTSTIVNPSTLKPGKRAAMTISLTNNGNIDTTGSASITLGASTDGTTTPSLSFGTQSKALKIKVGKKVMVKVSFTLPTDAAAGTYFPIATVTQNNSTTTNAGSSTFVIQT